MKTVLIKDIPSAPFYPTNSSTCFDNSKDAVRFASAKKPMPIIKRPTKKGKTK